MSARNIVLTEKNWRNDLEQFKLPRRVISLLTRAITAWSGRMSVRSYPQTSPEEFDELQTYEVETILISMEDGSNKTFRPELRLDGNHRHLVIRRLYDKKKKREKQSATK